MTRLAHIADRVLNRPLMILPDKLALIASVLEGRIGIDGSGFADIEAEYLKYAPDASRFVGNYEPNDPGNKDAGRKPYRQTANGVAIIPVLGSLVNRGAWVGAYSGLTSYEGFKFALGRAAADSSVTSIILDMDSPGGEAVGAFEAGDAVRAAAAVKEVVAVVNGMACSAAYAIAAQASRIITTSSGISGSIGVVMLHADYSVALHERGVKPTLIHAGARKVDGNPYQPLTDDVKGELKAEIDRFYDLFVASVAKGRKGLSEEAIRATEARTYIGADAVAVGLADAVGSFETVLSDLTSRMVSNKPRGYRAMTDTTTTTTQQPLAPQAQTGATAEALAAARADGERAGRAAERTRIAAVLDHDNANGRETLARHFLFNTDMTADQAIAALAVAPAAQAEGGLAAAMNRHAAPSVGNDAPGAQRQPAKTLNYSQIYERRKTQSQR